MWVRTLPLLFLFITQSSLILVAQSEEKDKADAVRVAREMSRYLQQIQDLRQVLQKYAVKRFMDGTSDDRLFNVLAGLDEDVLPTLDHNTRNRFYIAASNFIYGAVVYSCCAHEHSPKDADDIIFPPKVEKLMRGMPFLSHWLGNNGEDRRKPKTPKEVRSATHEIERVNATFRQYLTVIRRMPFKQYLLTVKPANFEWQESFTTQVSKCDDTFPKCLGSPVGTRLIFVNVPGFYGAEFIRQNGRMRLIHIYQFPGD